MSPFQALYGREPPMLVAPTPSPRTPPTVAELIRQRGDLLSTLRRNLQGAQQRMRAAANKHRRHVEFAVGDLVWLRLQPYRQHSVARPTSAKLARRYYGPFEVLQRVGPVAYKLRLPDGSRIHDVFHVSLLRPFVKGADSVDTVPLPATFLDGRPVSTPVSYLDSKLVLQDGDPVEFILVRWSDDGGAPTWEPKSAILRYFPTLQLEDKSHSNGGGVDTDVALTTPVEDDTSTSTESTEEEEEREAAHAGRSLRPRDTLKAPRRYEEE